MEAEKEKKGKRLIRKLKIKYRLVVMNDETYEEKASLLLSPMNVFVVFGSIILFTIISVTYIIAFTGLKEYIPGYASDITIKRKLVVLSEKADSLIEDIRLKDEYIKNINDVITGNVKSEKGNMPADSSKAYSKLPLGNSREDSILRAEIESQDNYSLAVNDNKDAQSGISSFFFFTPLNGVVSNSFKASSDHYGIDIVAKKNDAVKATLDGTVILATWSLETGYVIQLQHSNDLISVYKHNSALMKKMGERVKAGEVIAIVGNSGELTNGPHLHFELWYHGNSVNPQDYISF